MDHNHCTYLNFGEIYIDERCMSSLEKKLTFPSGEVSHMLDLVF